MLTMTRKQQLLEAFREAGARGLTAREMQALVGAFWKLRLRELRNDGCLFCEHRSRRSSGQIFRWQLVLEPVPPPAADEPRLFEPPPSPPRNAIAGEDEAPG